MQSIFLMISMKLLQNCSKINSSLLVLLNCSWLQLPPLANKFAPTNPPIFHLVNILTKAKPTSLSAQLKKSTPNFIVTSVWSVTFISMTTDHFILIRFQQVFTSLITIFKVETFYIHSLAHTFSHIETCLSFWGSKCMDREREEKEREREREPNKQQKHGLDLQQEKLFTNPSSINIRMIPDSEFFQHDHNL